ncbi:MAG: Prepilin peptidase [Firmicutes bacterium]|nr:Prepilin peptidase [Bacillota bacterium]
MVCEFMPYQIHEFVYFHDAAFIGFLFVFAVLGLLIGSFLNVCIYRLPRSQSVFMPPSHCPACLTRIKPQDLIPVLSYVRLHGRCRHCHAFISPRYAFVELLTSGLFVWSFLLFGLSAMLVKALILSSFLIVIIFIDMDYQLILDKVLLFLAGTGFLLNFWTGHVGLWEMLITGLSAGGLFLLIAVLTRGGMGGGDIKFAAAIGIWLGAKLTVAALFIAFILGGLGGIMVLALKLKSRKDYIPFGPFIALGAWISFLYGTKIIAWYLVRVV